MLGYLLVSVSWDSWLPSSVSLSLLVPASPLHVVVSAPEICIIICNNGTISFYLDWKPVELWETVKTQITNIMSWQIVDVWYHKFKRHHKGRFQFCIYNNQFLLLLLMPLQQSKCTSEPHNQLFTNLTDLYTQRNITIDSFISYLSYKLHCCKLLDKYCLSHSLYLYQVMLTLHFLNDVANDAESTKKLKITS